MSDPVFSVERHAELVRRAVARARAEEREKIASVLLVQANSVGGVIGAALREVADQVRGGSTVAPVVVGVEARRDLRDDGTDPPLSVPFDALTEPQRQRRLAKYAQELEEANRRQAAAFREDEERIERERLERQRRGETADDSIASDAGELPPVVLTGDEDDFHLAQRKLR